MNISCQSDIDLLQTEECIGRKARYVLDPEIVGHVIHINVNLSSRSYTLEWPLDGSIHQSDFYGFQLELVI